MQDHIDRKLLQGIPQRKAAQQSPLSWLINSEDGIQQKSTKINELKRRFNLIGYANKIILLSKLSCYEVY